MNRYSQIQNDNEVLQQSASSTGIKWYIMIYYTWLPRTAPQMKYTYPKTTTGYNHMYSPGDVNLASMIKQRNIFCTDLLVCIEMQNIFLKTPIKY